MDGFIVIDKPRGMTSFDVVRAVRSALAERQAGHAGTLDPAATGVLLVALGRCTRLLPFLPTEPKEYEFAVRFGVDTDTQDDTGREIGRSDVVPEDSALRAAIERFTGTVTQSPPRFSAVKIAGTRAYERARRNEEFETRPREVRIEQLALLSFDHGSATARFRLRCSGGTYVRSLASDIARALGTCGHAADIRRTAVGRFVVGSALPFTRSAEDLRQALVPADKAFEGRTRARLDEGQVKDVAFGRRIRLSDVAGEEPAVAFTPGGGLAAVLQPAGDGWWRPARVFVEPEKRQGGRQ